MVTNAASTIYRYYGVNSDGTYTANGLPAGSYTVCFLDFSAGSQSCWNGVSSAGDATPVPVGLGQISGGIDGRLP